MRILDEQGREVPPGQVGEICGRGPLMMAGYYKRPDLTAQAIVDGWLHSGDLGYVDEDGYLFLVDRKKDMIISGGVNVYPRDIEEVVVQHPGVREVAVFGVPDARWGETPVAAVMLRAPGAATADELTEWINARVGAKFQRVERRADRRRVPPQRRRQDAQARPAGAVQATVKAERATPHRSSDRPDGSVGRGGSVPGALGLCLANRARERRRSLPPIRKVTGNNGQTRSISCKPPSTSGPAR